MSILRMRNAAINRGDPTASSSQDTLILQEGLGLPNSGELYSIFVGDLHLEDLFNRHDVLHQVERIGVEIFWAEVKSLVSLPSSQQPFVASPYNVPLLSVVHELLLLMRLLRQLTWRASLNKFCLVGSPPCVIDTERPF